MGERRRAAVLHVALVLAATLPYAGGLRHGFVYDDRGVISENPFLRDPANLRRVLTLRTIRDPRVVDGRRPLLLATYFADRALWGMSPSGHRAANLALHAATVLSLYRLGLLLLRAAPGGLFVAFAAAAVFAAHPAATEAVHAPGFRGDVLAMLFVALYLLAAAAPATRGRPALQALPLALGLASKEAVVVAPLLMAWMWACFPSARPARRAAAAGLGLGAAAVLAYVVFALGGAPVQASGEAWNGLSLRFPENLLTSPWIALRYLGILVWPHPLCVDRIVAPVGSALDPRFLAGAALAVAVLAGAWSLRRRRPPLAFGLGWAALAYAPVSNLSPLFNPMAERYLYAILFGFSLAAASLMARAPGRGPALALACAVLAGLTALRLVDWRDDATLWTATLRAEPRSARAHAWLGLERKRLGDPDGARAHFEEATRLNPRDVVAPMNLAILDGQRGDLAGAEARLRRIVAARPDRADAHANLAVVLRLQGRAAEADAAEREARRLDPWSYGPPPP
jgi:tetratricopeptide (TPR) repeat protein